MILFFTCVGAALGPLAMGAVGDIFQSPRAGFVLATGFAALLFAGLLANALFHPAKALLARLEQSEYEHAAS